MVEAIKPVKRFPARNHGSEKSSTSSASSSRPLFSSIPVEIAEDPALLAVIDALLPSNYHFEVPKTVWQVRKNAATRVALQLPEGLAMWACALADIVERFTGAETVILGDVTYGACCVDDYTARALGCDMLVHYGHSCLVPVDTTQIKTLYVFVEISVDRRHLAETVRFNFPGCVRPDTKDKGPAIAIEQPIQRSEDSRPLHLACVGTVQFLSAVQGLQEDLDALDAEPHRLAITDREDQKAEELPDKAVIKVLVPQVKPLSPGEILGCTAPRLPAETEALLYIGDGRFHLESIMIANPHIPAYRYDPYDKRLTSEGYAHEEMQQLRAEAVEVAKASLHAEGPGGNWGVILGTLGRQGSLNVLNSITSKLSPARYIPILLSELSPAKLTLLAASIGVFVQTSCPRLSIDWGYAFPRPLLTPYEGSIALGRAKPWQGAGTYAMDFYADDSGGEWTPRYLAGLKAKEMQRQREERARLRASAAIK